MNEETIKERIKILEAILEDKSIEWKHSSNDKWVVFREDKDIEYVLNENYGFRLKKEPIKAFITLYSDGSIRGAKIGCAKEKYYRENVIGAEDVTIHFD